MAVLRYIAEAPLTALTQIYKHKLASCLAAPEGAAAATTSMQSGLDMAAVSALFAEASREISDVKESVRMLSECIDDNSGSILDIGSNLRGAVNEVRELRDCFVPKFVRNTSTGRIHAVRSHVRLLPPALWHANCRWKFGDKCDIEWLRAAPPESPEAPRCFRCFG